VTLVQEVEKARRQVKTDSYAMSLGELVTMYESRELNINPAFQRLFRWNINQKSRFVESVLLGIPVPSIFVFETENSQWELVDGLQRVSTVLEFMGKLRVDGKEAPPSSLIATKYLPSLKNIVWEKSNKIRDIAIDEQNQLDKSFQFDFRRSKIGVQILKRSTDEYSKYDLFQRLNAGGTIAEPQEVRNCAVIMANAEFFAYLKDLAENPEFKSVSRITDSGTRIQKHMEYIMRFFVLEGNNFDQSLDVEEFTDTKIIEMATDDVNFRRIGSIFERVFRLLNAAFGPDALRRYDGNAGKFTGQVGFVALEAIAVGIGRNMDQIEQMQAPVDFVTQKIKDFWARPEVSQFSAAGLSGTRRITQTVPFGEQFFRP